MSDHDPYAAARAHVELAAQTLPDDKADRLRWRLEAAMILNPVTGAVGFLDGSRDPAEWLRNVARAEPDLLAKPAQENAAQPSTVARSTIGPDPFRFASKTLHAAPGSISDLMVRAKTDPAARAELMAKARRA